VLFIASDWQTSLRNVQVIQHAQAVSFITKLTLSGTTSYISWRNSRRRTD